MFSSWSFRVTAFIGLWISLATFTACNDELEDTTPCKNVECDDNAVCDPNVNACVCRSGFEEDEHGECVESIIIECTKDADCDDELVCNGKETCDVEQGKCVAGEPIECEENRACTEPEGSCECERFLEEIDGECVELECTEDGDCDDGIACNGIETCDVEQGQCVAGTPVLCNGDYQDCVENDTDRGYSCEVVAPDNTTACALVQTTDWGSVGTLAVLNLETGEMKDNITTYAQDAVVRVANDEVYVLERHMYDAVLKLDAYDDYKTLWNFSIAHEDFSIPNPWDMVAWGDYFFINLYNDGRILRVNANPDANDLLSFMGNPPYTRRIDPPEWDKPFSELAYLRVDGDILFGLTQGLDEAWNCGTDENRGRIYAFNLPDLTDANIFEDGKNYVTLEHCNPGGWVDMPDGRILVHSLGDYRSIQGGGDDGGLQLFDIQNRTLGNVVATESTVGDQDIFSVERVGERVFVLTVGMNFGELDIHELFVTEDDSPWTMADEPLLVDHIWSSFGFGNILYATIRSPHGEALARINVDTLEEEGERVETTYPPENMTLFFREGDSCW